MLFYWPIWRIGIGLQFLRHWNPISVVELVLQSFSKTVSWSNIVNVMGSIHLCKNYVNDILTLQILTWFKRMKIKPYKVHLYSDSLFRKLYIFCCHKNNFNLFNKFVWRQLHPTKFKLFCWKPLQVQPMWNCFCWECFSFDTFEKSTSFHSFKSSETTFQLWSLSCQIFQK